MPTMKMKKQWYDHKSQRCPSCHFYRAAGKRATALGEIDFPEGCGNYGYSFHPYPEPADDCDGFITTAQWEADEQARELLKKKKSKKK